ncbi:MAG: hypothetical protein M3347_10725, partial [Armatimonadota bacterium]|nr:hypothetical protein [Armatimonadota bacterium]
GELGKVSRVEVWHEPNFCCGGWEIKEPPPELDWNLWLGPMAWRPYNPSHAHFNFRWLMDSGAGFIRDRGNHVLSIVSWCMDADSTGPISVEASGQRDPKSSWDVPVTMSVKWEFKNPDWTLTWDQPGARYPMPGTDSAIPWGAKFYGDRDTLIFAGGDSGQDVERKVKEYRPPAGGVQVYRSSDHYQNWIDGIRTRRQPIMPPEIGHRVISLAIIANIAYQLGRKLTWDSVNEEFTGDAEANRFLHYPYRPPWRLGV